MEEVLANELKQLGASTIELRNRAVVCFGDLMFLYKLNYSSRLALKIIVPIFHFEARNDEELYQECIRLPWEEYISVHDTFYIDYTVFSEHFSHSQYAMLKMKDAIADRLKLKYKKRPSVAMDEKSIKLNLHIQNQKVTISLDSSGEPLYKRGYRTQTGEAPINEVLAAGMLALSGWEGSSHFLDPMCGSGTLLIEAAMNAFHIPSQIHRKHFAFMNWKNFDEKAWEKIKSVRLAKIKEFEYNINGYDHDWKSVARAKENIKNADLEEVIKVEDKDFFKTQKENAPLLLMLNPPYNERMEIDDTFYKRIGDTLKQNYPYVTMWIISSDLRIDKKLGLRPSQKIKLFNGKLECKFVKYETYEGSKKSKFTD